MQNIMNEISLTSKAVGFPMPVGSWLYNYAQTRIHNAILQIVAMKNAPGYVEDLNDYEGDSEDEGEDDEDEDGECEDDDQDEDEDQDQDEDDDQDQEYCLTQTDIVELETWNQTDMSAPPMCMLSNPVMYTKYKQVLRLIDFECKIHKTCGGCDDCAPFFM
jgi:TATA-binding protein-associated factor Taf7